MTYSEKQQLTEAHQGIRKLEQRVEALTEMMDVVMNRKQGRPTKEDAATIEELKARAHG